MPKIIMTLLVFKNIYQAEVILGIKILIVINLASFLMVHIRGDQIAMRGGVRFFGLTNPLEWLHFCVYGTYCGAK